MKAHPYLIKDSPKAKGIRLERIDPREKKFDEKWLQDLIIQHPDLLPTGEIEAIFEPLVLMGREIPISGGRIDILFMTPHGYPVIVETKLWRNPESRRDVVGQVLDFAFALSKWDFDRLNDGIKQHSTKGLKRGQNIRALMKKHLETHQIGFDEFKERVEKNLRLGRFLVAVVGDRIRSSSRDILEGLNRYPGLGIELTMIELECFSVDQKKDTSMLIVPRIAKETEIIERSIVEVNVLHEGKPSVAIEQVKTEKSGKITLTESEFWDHLRKKAPQNYDKIKTLYEMFQNEPLIEIKPGTNGLVFRRIIPESNRFIGLFFITTDSAINVKVQAPRLQFKSLGFNQKPVEEYGKKVKEVLNGKFRAIIDEVNISKFKKVVHDFIDEFESKMYT
jgi:hypothetical protein